MLLSLILLIGCAALDMDGDGVPHSLDCDDHAAAVFPGNDELYYDGLDNDCDPDTVDDDADGDGLPKAQDCDDHDPAVDQPVRVLELDLSPESVDLSSLCEDTCGVHLIGDVNLGRFSADALAQLSCLRVIEGDLTLEGAQHLESLRGLEGLVRVQGDLRLTDNPGLLSLDGLNGLGEVTGDFALTGDPRLQDLSGLDRLSDVGGLLQVTELDGLGSLDGLERLREIGALTLYHNLQLEELSGLSGVSRVKGAILIRNNPCLTPQEIDALIDGIDAIWGEVDDHNTWNFDEPCAAE